MTDEQQPQGNVEPAQPPPDPASAPVQADPVPIAPDPRLIEVKEFNEQPGGMTFTGDGAPRDGGSGDG